MRVARIKPPDNFLQPAYFHCVSRIVNRDFVIKEQEKEFFVKWMRKYEAFCGVRVVTFCILDNHVHLLVEVPPVPEQELSDEQLLERLAIVSKKSVIWETRQLLERYRKEGNDQEAQTLRRKICGRMHDVSSFMKQLKQRFSQWFNKKHGRCGTLWEDRFKSVLVEGAGMTLATMAAYIDLNPVRAKIVERNALGTDLIAESSCCGRNVRPPSLLMRVARIKPPDNFLQPAYFHCVSRIVNRDFVIKEQEKEFFVKWMRKYEAFCGVRVVTFCILDNHVHLLIEVPPVPEQELSDEQLLERLAIVSKKSVIWETRQLLERYRKEGNDQEAQTLRRKICGRMHDVSSFMKQLKQRFSQWFNKKHGRCGTLWEDRFKSVLVEGAGMTLATMAAYIDLNPVRAKIVEDPKDYRWSGYGQAIAGKKEAVEGLGVIAQFFGMEKCSRREIMERYRVWVYEEGAERKPDPVSGSKGRAGIKRERVDATVARGGKLTRGELLRVRVRYFLDGAILGSRGFVEEILEARREEIGLKRKTGATRMQGGDWGGLCTLRALRVGVLGKGA